MNNNIQFSNWQEFKCFFGFHLFPEKWHDSVENIIYAGRCPFCMKKMIYVKIKNGYRRII